MTATMTKNVRKNNKENTVSVTTTTPDIVRKTQFRNGQEVPTNAYLLAKMLTDGRRKGRPVSRQEIVEKLGFDPAPYVKLYDCFEAVDRGQYIYTGTAVNDL